MVDPSPLFITGVARSGTTLVAKLLDAHPALCVASDPLFPLFRSLRTAVVSRNGTPDMIAEVAPTKPIGDYYFRPVGQAIVDAMRQGTLCEPLEERAWPELLHQLQQRAIFESPDLVPHLADIKGSTYKELVDAALRLIGQVRGSGSEQWAGIKDVWLIEFLPLLARAYPSARFILVNRDPRATVASALGIPDISQRPHPLSFIRHCRKHFAFAHWYKDHPALASRIYTCSYEGLVRYPELTARALCEFLGVEFVPEMLNQSKYLDHRTRQTWAGNSSFSTENVVTEEDRAELWRSKLAPWMVRLIELVSGYEMGLAGYERTYEESTLETDPAVLQGLLDSQTGNFSWRTDLEDPPLDYALEMVRSRILGLSPSPSQETVRRFFLFECVYDSISNKRNRAAR